MRQRPGRDGHGGADGDEGGEPAPHDGRILASDGTIRCGVVSGHEAKDWYTAVTGANQLTRFVKGDHWYEVTVRFQLPDEPLECPAPPA